MGSLKLIRRVKQKRWKGIKINMEEGKITKLIVKIKVDDTALDIAIEKANRLVELLQEAQRIAGSFLDKEELET